MSERVSVAIIAKNAGDHLENCLRSVAWADEIVLVDGHSADRTREIAKSYGAKVFEKDFESFPAERAYALRQTSHNWILSVDADMIVPVPLAREIRALLDRGPDCDAYSMRCLNHFLGREIRHCSWFDHRFLRLFDKRKGAYDLSMSVLDQFVCMGRIGRLEHHLVHHQTESLEQYLNKMTRQFAPMTAEEYRTKGVRIAWWNVPWYFLVRPGLIFLHKYLWKRGFMDGVPGLVICLNSAIGYYLAFSILWDRQQGTPQYGLERYLPEQPPAPADKHE